MLVSKLTHYALFWVDLWISSLFVSFFPVYKSKPVPLIYKTSGTTTGIKKRSLSKNVDVNIEIVFGAVIQMRILRRKLQLVKRIQSGLSPNVFIHLTVHIW